MIDFMLQQLGQTPVIPGLKLQSLALQILIAHNNPSPPFDLHEDRKKAEAPVPHYDLLRTALDDLRINQRPRLNSGQLQKNHSLHHPDLRSRNTAPVASCR